MLGKNLEMLQKHYPDLHQSVVSFKKTGKCVEEKSKNGMTNLQYTSDDGIKIMLHSQYDPAREAKMWVNNVILDKEDSLVIIGLGLGYYLPYLRERYSEKKLIIIEPDLEVFYHALKIQDLSTYFADDNIVFLVEHIPYMIATSLQGYVQSHKIKEFYISELPIYRRVYGEYIKNVYRDIQEQIRTITINMHTEILFSKQWLSNLFKNLPSMTSFPSVKKLAGNFKGVPAVIVAAGPSLEKNMHILKQIYDRALIISVGSSANILERNGIIPHIVMGVDGGEGEANIFENLTNHSPLFVYANTVHHRAIESYNGKKMWLIMTVEKVMPQLDKQLDGENPVIQSGPSVANIALAFADYLQCSPIMLIGQDLAYTNTKLYADGAVHQADPDLVEKFKSNSSYVKMKGINGEDIYTKKPFLSMKKWFEDYVTIFERNTNIYNCTEGGLPIKGIPNYTFQHCVDEFCTRFYPIEEKIKKVYEEGEGLNKEKVSHLMGRIKEEIEEIVILSGERLKKLEKIKPDDLCFDKDFSDIIKVGEKIEQTFTYDSIIAHSVNWYLNFQTRHAYEQMEREKAQSTEEKRKSLLGDLLIQYAFIHDYIKLAKETIEEWE
ncbi:motility associated factor glycosyltransferase family protein [Aneurinibacillus uraniidurans]|uniref:motility associated factor glycosyltransferase family protein n=1 Tax=Aneurinibacillus uraniidurans TaxID=2966586 RepID=UPI00234BF307|nr:6-hydroxymethylpterin diphosphokinase MptE-like protein [Aneurinibacillus sp. B1]WCN38138.1 DUF115 domain-containing protein [Aneurinibacillus sp. B1]